MKAGNATGLGVWDGVEDDNLKLHSADGRVTADVTVESRVELQEYHISRGGAGVKLLRVNYSIKITYNWNGRVVRLWRVYRIS